MSHKTSINNPKILWPFYAQLAIVCELWHNTHLSQLVCLHHLLRLELLNQLLVLWVILHDISQSNCSVLSKI